MIGGASLCLRQGKPSLTDKILGREKPHVENGPDPEKDRQGYSCA